MKTLTTSLIAPYVVFAFFHFYISWTVKNYRGASQAFGFVLAAVAFAGMLFQYGFVLVLAWRISLAAAGLLLLVGFAAVLVLMPLELYLRKTVHRDMPAFLGIAAIPVLPVAAWFMVRAWPSTPH